MTRQELCANCGSILGYYTGDCDTCLPVYISMEFASCMMVDKVYINPQHDSLTVLATILEFVQDEHPACQEVSLCYPVTKRNRENAHYE